MKPETMLADRPKGDISRSRGSPIRRGRLLVVMSGAAAILGNCWQAIRLWHRCNRDIAILQAAEDHMLKDIGIGRSEIESVVREGRDPFGEQRAGRK